MSTEKYTILEPIPRFWSKVNKNAPCPKHRPELGNCWEWIGTCFHSSGYGQFALKRKSLLAHRFSWKITYGDIPEGIFVLHKCDNKKCVNPEHLFLGTQKDNSDDKVSKNRQPRAENHGMAKLSNSDVLQIRELWKTEKYSQREIGEMFGVKQAWVSQIVLGNKRRSG